MQCQIFYICSGCEVITSKEMQECGAYESGVVLSRNSILVQDILVNPKK